MTHTAESLTSDVANQLTSPASGSIGQSYYLADFKPSTARYEHDEDGTTLTETYIFVHADTPHPKAYQTLFYGTISAMDVKDDGMVVLSLRASNHSSELMGELWHQQLSTFHHIVNHDTSRLPTVWRDCPIYHFCSGVTLPDDKSDVLTQEVLVLYDANTKFLPARLQNDNSTFIQPFVRFEVDPDLEDAVPPHVEVGSSVLITMVMGVIDTYALDSRNGKRDMVDRVHMNLATHIEVFSI